MSKPRKRKGSPYYWYDFTVGGVRYRGSTQTDSLETAKAIIAKLRLDAVKGNHFADVSKMVINMETACARFLLEHAQYLKSYRTINSHITHLLSLMGGNMNLAEISNKDVHAYVAHRRAQVDDKGERLVTDTTINRELETLRKIINVARDKWEHPITHINFRQHMLREPEARTRWITHQQADKLIAAAADHLKAPIRFALLTGVRRSNITGLRWKDVNLQAREISFRIKSNIPGGKLLVLPITDELMALLKSQKVRPQYINRRRVADNNGQPVPYTTNQNDYVFTYKGEPITNSFKKSFASACIKAKIEDFRFHDLRHTAASWMIQSGVPIDLVQEILGHTQIATTKKYAHRDQAEKLAALTRMHAASQSRHTEPTKKAS